MKKRILALGIAALAFTLAHAQEKSTLHLSGTTNGVSTGKVYLHKFSLCKTQNHLPLKSGICH